MAGAREGGFRVTRIVSSPTFASLTGRIPVQALAALSTALSYTQEEVFLKRKKGEPPRREHQTRRIPLIVPHGDGYAFPAGLIHRASAAVNLLGLSLEVHAGFTGPDEPPRLVDKLPDGTELYEDQRAAIAALLRGRRGLGALAPNFGKTEVMAAILAAYPTMHALVLDSNKARVEQTAARLTERLREEVTIFAGRRDYRTPRVTVATIQTLARCLESGPGRRLLNAPILLVDEVHAVSPRQWFPALGSCQAWLRLGLSGSVRDVAAPVITEAFFGPILHEVDEGPLIAAGRSAAISVFMPYAGSLVPDSEDYDEVYQRAVVESLDRNSLLAKAIALCARLGLPTVVLFYRREHGERLERTVAREGGSVPSLVRRLDGRTPPWEIEDAKKQFTAGTIQVLIASGIFNQGIDLPTMRVLINAAAWKSPLATGQKQGRVARRKIEVLPDGSVAWGDNRGLIIDPFDLGNRTLKRHSEARERTYTKKGSAVRRGVWTDLVPAIENWAKNPSVSEA